MLDRSPMLLEYGQMEIFIVVTVRYTQKNVLANIFNLDNFEFPTEPIICSSEKV